MRVVAVALVVFLAGCAATQDPEPDAPQLAPEVGRAESPSAAPTALPQNATPASRPNQTPTGSNLANVTTGLWTRLSFELSGGAGEWVWFFQPLPEPTTGLSYSTAGSITARGEGRVAAFVSDGELVNSWDGAPPDHVLAWQGSLAAATAVADDTAKANAGGEDVWSAGCTNCTFRAVMGFAGATAPWTALISFDAGDGPLLENPVLVVHGNGTWFEEFTGQGTLPASAQEPWVVERPVDAGISVWTFIPPADPGGYGNVTAHMASERHLSDSGSRFLEGVSGVPNFSMTRWVQAKVGFPADTSQLIVERTGVQAPLHASLIHAPGLILPPLMRDGSPVRS